MIKITTHRCVAIDTHTYTHRVGRLVCFVWLQKRDYKHRQCLKLKKRKIAGYNDDTIMLMVMGTVVIVVLVLKSTQSC